ncbi:MAG: 2Fe-2S iron-sulfur cluster binding domain-containing protein [gamma proteobacterium symbiont of Bathyaustriella thionipta]|nr:2Fe-2S iron-sulfur cluster binding domain-containing protein [gamma proteobacterium symbiont of Bathyaustriella thionipta]MCU7951600.1 2Fe-2S iron-sulfur cluster binding domain-containing protein [gamma proteobacterium symbiont of Bathyaustriella thionipta]MCU7958204.1 2Fe-2S iron-sulfur cluster binding domain-containing protein [gamma proteobacterium symbiont of Bathyaustriella thionipta]MCU7965941.1 2Fe-2S iron-sulfur cluster binding domain-containing protein [gamma proteobacterium symbiont
MPTYHFTISSNDTFSLDKSTHSYVLDRGQSLLKNLTLHNILVYTKCGGKAICGYCRIKILSGHKYCNKPVSEEKIILNEQELKQGWRLVSMANLYDVNSHVFNHKN